MEQRRVYQRLFYRENKEEVLARQSGLYKKNPALLRAKILRYNHKWMGYPLPTREAPDNCECCGNPPNGHGALHLDHCHKTGTFRGWLCMKCNTAIGKLGDNIGGLQMAIDYLKRSQN